MEIRKSPLNILPERHPEICFSNLEMVVIGIRGQVQTYKEKQPGIYSPSSIYRMKGGYFYQEEEVFCFNFMNPDENLVLHMWRISWLDSLDIYTDNGMHWIIGKSSTKS